MVFVFVLLMGAVLGYIYGNMIRPNLRLQKALQEVKAKCLAVLEGGRTGVYRTIVTDNQKSSELVVEIKELAVTQAGQVKVQYLNAFYKNPVFRTRKGDALLQEVQGLLGDYLPETEIEWFETADRNAKIEEFVHRLDSKSPRKLGQL
jgi:hypothetical protein